MVAEVRAQMERARARKLQPHFLSAFFREAFDRLGGRIVAREQGRFEITRVPSILKHRDRLIGRADPVLDRYGRVTFDKAFIAGQPQAELLAPGHPLMTALVDIVLEHCGPTLKQGAVLIDDAGEGEEPRLLVILEHAIRDGRTSRTGEPRVISQRLQFVYLRPDGSGIDAGPAPHLDLRPASEAERAAIADLLGAPWLARGIEERALAFAIGRLVPEHLAEVKARRLAELDKIEREVRNRLQREINYWDARAARLREEERAGKQQRINAQNAEAIAQRLVERLHAREQELARERQIAALKPDFKGAALVVPAGLLRARLATPTADPRQELAEDAASRAEVERLAMEAVLAQERALGHEPRDVSAEKKGWDIESRDGRTGSLRFLEVKGRRAGAREIVLTRNELLAALNAPDAYYLALVEVENGFARRPAYLQRFVTREPGFAETAVVFAIDELLALAGQATVAGA